MAKKMSVYIASAYTKGDVAVNVRKSIEYADKLTAAGFVVFCPLLTHFWHLVSPHPKEFWIEQDNYWVAKCDILFRDGSESSGADAEVEIARQHGITVYYDIAELLMNKARMDMTMGGNE